MLKIIDLLKTINAYPVPRLAIAEMGLCRGVYVEDDAEPELIASDSYKGVKADIMMWLAKAPNITQGGQSYSLSEYERKRLRQEASDIYREIGEPDKADGKMYGYKGDRL